MLQITRALGDKVLLEGVIVGMERLKDGRIAYQVEVPDYYCGYHEKLEPSTPERVCVPEKEFKEEIVFKSMN